MSRTKGGRGCPFFTGLRPYITGRVMTSRLSWISADHPWTVRFSPGCHPFETKGYKTERTRVIVRNVPKWELGTLRRSLVNARQEGITCVFWLLEAELSPVNRSHRWTFLAIPEQACRQQKAGRRAPAWAGLWQPLATPLTSPLTSRWTQGCLDFAGRPQYFHSEDRYFPSYRKVCCSSKFSFFFST